MLVCYKVDLVSMCLGSCSLVVEAKTGILVEVIC